MNYGWVHARPIVPICPLLVGPNDAAVEAGFLVDTSVTVVLTWGSVEDATYNLYINGSLYVSDLDDTTYDLVGLDFSTPYEWEIRAVVNGVESTGCSTRTFTTIEEVVVADWFTFVAGMTNLSPSVTLTGYGRPPIEEVTIGTTLDDEQNGDHAVTVSIYSGTFDKFISFGRYRLDNTYPPTITSISFLDKNSVLRTFNIGTVFNTSFSILDTNKYCLTYTWALAVNASTDYFNVGDTYTISFNV